MKRKQWLFITLGLTVMCLLIFTQQTLLINAGQPLLEEVEYNSPYALAYSPEGKYLAVTNTTGARLDIIDVEGNKVYRTVPLLQEPKGVVWEGDHIFVAEYGAGTVAQIDGKTFEIIQRFPAGTHPVDIAVNKGDLLVTDFGENQLLAINLESGDSRTIEISNPYYFDICPDNKYVFVGQLTPADPSTGANEVAVVDLDTWTLVANIALPYGSSNVRDVKVSPDAKWVYVAHTLGKTNLPVTHITKGWVNTNAISVINLDSMERLATFLLDRLSEAAANPWGLAVSADSDNLWVSISGVHQVLKLDMEHLLSLMLGEGPSFRDNDARNMLYRSKSGFDRPYSDVWFKIKDDPKNLELLQNDLGALWGAGVMEKNQLPGAGPRGIALSADNKRLAVTSYFTGEVFILDAETNQLIQSISLGEVSEETSIRRGERLFHDATLAQQSWLSCATCHPDGKKDGLQWDLPDGRFGNPTNTVSLESAYRNLGDELPESIRGAFWVEMITQPQDEDVEAIGAYIKSLAP